MPFQVEIRTNFEDYQQLFDFYKDLQENVIKTGYDQLLEKDVEKLRQDLKFVINEKIRISDDKPVDTSSSKDQEIPLGQKAIDPPKSEEEIIKYLTDGKTDLSKYNNAKDYSTLSETGLVVGQLNSQGNNNRVSLRLEIDSNSTIEQQYAQATEFFKDAVFAFSNNQGTLDYYINPGFDLSPYIKIKCSTFVGEVGNKPNKGMSPQDRFKRYSDSGKDYAEWTLKQDAISLIKQRGLNISEVVNLIKDGDYTSASKILKSQFKKTKIADPEKIDKLTERLDTLNTNKNTTTVDKPNYFSLIEMINNLYFEKVINRDDVIYSLAMDSDVNIEADIEQQISSSVRQWLTVNENPWFEEIVKMVENLITYYVTTRSSTPT